MYGLLPKRFVSKDMAPVPQIDVNIQILEIPQQTVAVRSHAGCITLKDHASILANNLYSRVIVDGIQVASPTEWMLMRPTSDLSSDTTFCWKNEIRFLIADFPQI